MGRETEEQLLQRIQNEQNPVKKAKDEIKLANLKLTQIQEAYSQGQIEAGAKLLGTFVGRASKPPGRLLQDSGRRASKQPEGFRELEISLREDVRALQDLGANGELLSTAPPWTNAAEELDQMRSEVLHALFPGRPRQPAKVQPLRPRPATPGSPAAAR